MAEFLIATQDRTNGTRRGDIIAVRPDGMPWGSRETIGEGFAIYAQPNLSIVEFSALEPDPELGAVAWLDEAALPSGLIDAAEAIGRLEGTAEGVTVFLGALRWR